MLNALLFLYLLHLALSSFAVVSSTFIDDAHHLDFHHALLGPPLETHTFFHRPSAHSKGSLIYTLSQRGIIGAVNPKDGNIIWRQRLQRDDLPPKGNGLLKASTISTSIISGIDRNLQAWHAIDGRLQWTRRTTGPLKAIEVVQKDDSSSVIAVHEEQPSKLLITSFELENGLEHWLYQDSSGNTPLSLVVAQDRLFHVSLQPGLLKGVKVRAFELDVATGEKKGETHLFGSEGEISSHESILFAGTIGRNPVVIWSDKAFKNIKLGSLFQSRTVSLHIGPERDETILSVKVHAHSGEETKPHFLLQFEGEKTHWAYVYHIDPATGSVSKAHKLDAMPGRGAFATSSLGSDVFFVRHSSKGVSFTSSLQPTPFQTWQTSMEPNTLVGGRAVLHAIAEVAPRGTSNHSVRSVVSTLSGEWKMIRSGEISWVRNEGIAGVLAAKFAGTASNQDLARELAIEGQYGIIPAYFHRIKRHIKDLQALMSESASLLQSLLETSGHLQGIHRTERSRGKFGFGQIVILATAAGKLAALDMGKAGKIVWTQQIVSLKPNAQWNLQNIEINGGIALVFFGQGGIVKIAVSDGTIVHRQMPNDQTTSAIEADAQTIHGQRGSSSNGSDEILHEHQNRTHDGDVITVTRSDNKTIDGWKLVDAKRLHAWSFRAPSCESIIDAVYRPADESLASIGRVLGDRNVLYKYSNPNMVLVTAKDTCHSSVSFYLLDSASGRLFFTFSHSDVDLTRPISSILSGNFIAYSSFSKSNAIEGPQHESRELVGYNLGICELYASPFLNDRGPLNTGSNSSSLQSPLSDAEDTTPLHAITQSYLVSEPISHITLTTTLQGITPSSLLFIAPNSNSVVAIPRYILDPRRPIGRDPSSSEIEEGLFRYNPAVELDPKWHLTHERQLLGLSKILTNPTNLESTSLVFAFGDVDIFGTRISPIGSFDILGKEFSKFQLILTVAALAVGTAILAPMVCMAANSITILF